MLSVRPGRQKFVVDTPLPTHWRKATCKEIDCRRYVLGFRVQLDESVAKHKDAAEWMRHNGGLTFTESRDVEGLTTFAFPPGQECFDGKAGRHRLKLDKRELFSQQTVNGVLRTFQQPEEFTECWNEEMQLVERRLQRR